MNCDNCGASTHPGWARCSACGDLLTWKPPEGPRLLPDLGALRLRLASAGIPRLGALRLSRPTMRVRFPGGWRRPSIRMANPMTDRWRWRPARMAVLGVGAVLAGVLAVAATGALSTLAAERESARLASATVEEAQGRVQEAQTREAALEARVGALEGEVATLEREVEASAAAGAQALEESEALLAASGVEVSMLQARFDYERAALAQEQEQAEQLREHLVVARDCLDGMAVAIEFLRRSSRNSADRALEAVSASCEAARAMEQAGE